MPRTTVTRTRLENSAYPSFQVHWTEDEDCNGWTGVTQVWLDGNTKDGDEHTIHLRQGRPLGAIYVDVDATDHGAWTFSSFEGVTLTERDLQWAALYASVVMKHKALFLNALQQN